MDENCLSLYGDGLLLTATQAEAARTVEEVGYFQMAKTIEMDPTCT